MNECNIIEDKIYQDEIIPLPNRQVFVIPSILKEARKLEKDVWGTSHANIFVQQAKMLENYEDDYVYTKKSVHYFPTYKDLSNQELRGYFGWRTRLRNGNLEKTSLSFACIYCYELINQIGAKNYLDGYNKLVWFKNEYGKLDDSLNRNLENWIFDYVVYYNLSADLLIDNPIVKLDIAFSDLLEMNKSNEELFYALYELSIDAKTEYILKNEEHLKAFQNISVNVIKKMQEYFKSHRKQGFWEELFGCKWANKWVEMFKSAVFYDIKKKDKFNCKFQIDNLRLYECKNGIWLSSGYSYSDKARYELTTVLLSIKSLLYEYLGIKTEPCLYSKQWFVKIAKKEIKNYFDEEKRKKDSEIVIDYSILSTIRTDAEETQEKLITEEEIELNCIDNSINKEKTENLNNNKTKPETNKKHNNLKQIENISSIQETTSMQDASNNKLTSDEILFIESLIENKNSSSITKKGTMLTVLVDSINEKLFDLIGDTVIEFGDKPIIIEDYLEELKKIVGKNYI